MFVRWASMGIVCARSQERTLLDGRWPDLELTTTPNACAVSKDGAWALTMPGRPFAAKASDLKCAAADLVDNSRKYAAE